VADHTRRGLSQHAIHALLLVAFCALLFWVTRAVPEVDSTLWTVAAVGFLLLAGTLTSELLAPLGLPNLTGYLLAGIVSGPYLLKLVDASTVKNLTPINTLALALIALAGGAELELSALRKGVRSLSWATLVQSLLVLVLVAATFLAVRRLLPDAIQQLPLTALFGVSLLWGVLAVARSPSATLGILAQTRARGPLTTFTLGFVMASDVVVVILVAVVLACVRPLVDPASVFSLDAFKTLAHDLFGSIALGTTLGLFIAAYLRLVNRQMLVVLLVLGFGVSTVLDYLQFDALLTFMVAGFIVRNVSSQGQKFLQNIEQTGTVVYVIFFATAGADLDVPLLARMWPVALVLAGSRGLFTYAGARFSGWLANDSPMLRRWSWSGLVAQAGLVLGLASLVAKEFPTFGTPFRSLVVATVAVNQLVGPVLFKLALDRAGETSRAEAPSFSSIRPPAV
jgi:Kef-type K+ transport system membrane component KefB